MGARQYLTKSKFKVGLSCPRKLFYLDKPAEYADIKLDDPFLRALARGGYQVGELAKLHYPQGVEVLEKEHLAAVQRTHELLQQDQVVIFEAAFLFQSFFVRSDIVVKKGNHLQLIEVKSKSIDPASFRKDLWNTRAGKDVLKLKSNWYPYIYDLAFQTWVARQAFPEFSITSIFKAVNKAKTVAVDGLNTLFLIQKKGSRGFEVEKQRELTPDAIDATILAEIDLTDIVNDIIDGKEQTEFKIKKPFVELVDELSRLYLASERFPSNQAVGAQCKKCEFRTDHATLRSGFRECWTENSRVTEQKVSEPFVFDIGHFSKSEETFVDGIYLMEDLHPDEIKPSAENGKSGFLQSDRQKLQIIAVSSRTTEPTWKLEELLEEITSWAYPYHFIDFETCAPALPFTRGLKPYENIAFQFSHHILHENGKVEHEGQYINLTPGAFPNFDFVRALQQQLQKDQGTIFRYSHHENTVLNQIARQLAGSEEIDRHELMDFIKTITNHTPDGSKNKIRGVRDMVDLCEMVSRFYYSPRMGGSVSIKQVLPAVLNESEFLQAKYSQPMYGSDQLVSQNFDHHQWVQRTSKGEVSNPYHALPKIFDFEDLARIEYFLMEEEEIHNGGEAMMAYCMAQFTKMTELERERLKHALLRYCELDTLAMVMIVEYWQEVLLKANLIVSRLGLSSI